MTLRFSKEFWSARPAVPTQLPSDSGTSDFARFLAPSAQHAATPFIPPRPFLDTVQQRCALWVPESYEPNYAYPLLIWLHDAGCSEHELSDLMPQISPQNYVGLALRGSVPAGVAARRTGKPAPGSCGHAPVFGYRWPRSERAVAGFENLLYESVCQLRREYHIHSERIYVAGLGEGATMSLRLLLDHPEWFAGAIALCGSIPQGKPPLMRFRGLRDKRVLFGPGVRDRSVAIGEVVQAGRLLYGAGMHVSTRLFDAGRELTSEMLAHINQWVMEGIFSAV